MRNWFSLFSSSQEEFKVIVLGCGGGPLETNVSGYLLAKKNSSNFVALDAGSLLGGIFLAHKKKSFKDIPKNENSSYGFEGQILRDHIKAYLISHAHLDHVAGLVLNATIDTKKPIFGISTTIDYIRDYLFNGKIWPNFGSEGAEPCIHQYDYERIRLQEMVTIPDTGLSVEPFALSHPEGYPSTAFLIESSGMYIVYLGDTASDAMGSQNHLNTLWRALAPLIQQKKLRALFVECSYPEKHSTQAVEGHLDPSYLMRELHALADLVNPAHPKKALKHLNVVVTHIKDPFVKGYGTFHEVKKELEKANDLGVRWVFARQGDKLVF
ncbi:MAG TPA: 3',5'-cyclic-nucleotide phosphodiesterase [Rhabdochlamydiaceae bacterium]